MKSIRRSLCISIVCGLAVLSIITGVTGYIWSRHTLLSQADAVLIAKAKALSNLVEDEDGEIHFEFSDDNMPEFLSENPRHFFQVWLPGGKVLARSNFLDTFSLPQPKGTPAEPGVMQFHLPNGVEGRVVGFQFDPILESNDQRHIGPPKSAKASIAVGRETADLNALLNRLLFIISSGALMLPIIAALIVTTAVRRGLQPLHALSLKVEAIDASTLETKITEGGKVVELQPITEKLNDLLARLHTAFEREKRFTLDASHELRTPLAESRTSLEIALKWPDDKQLLLDSAAQALDATYQMESIVSALLALARAESDKTEALRETLDLRATIEHCWKQVSTSAPGKSLEISATSERDTVFTNKALLSAILTNLLTNAVQYSPENAIIFCEILPRPSTGVLSLVITNPVSMPLTIEDADHLFEPLWRKNKSRSEQSGAEPHFGLGLALVKAYCEKIGVAVETQVKEQEFTIQIQFPNPNPHE